MEHWTPWNWIAYGSLAITAFLIAIGAAAKEQSALSNWFPPFFKTSVLGYGPAIFFMIATAIFVIQFAFSRKATEKTRFTKVGAPIQTLPFAPEIDKPKKFYSMRDKENLANALTDLLELLNRDGSKIIQKAQKIIEQWRPRTLQDLLRKEPDIAAELDKLNELSNLAATFYQSIFEENGFIDKYHAYSEELSKIVQVLEKPSTTPNQPLIELQSGINLFRNMLIPIQIAEKYNDKNLTTWMINNGSMTFDNFQHKINLFRAWIDNTKRNITGFRNSHLS